VTELKQPRYSDPSMIRVVRRFTLNQRDAPRRSCRSTYYLLEEQAVPVCEPSEL
jgi:hypothetical protein